MYGPGAVTVSRRSRNDGRPSRLIRRRNEKTTSAEVRGVPSAKWASCRSRKVQSFVPFGARVRVGEQRNRSAGRARPVGQERVVDGTLDEARRGVEGPRGSAVTIVKVVSTTRVAPASVRSAPAAAGIASASKRPQATRDRRAGSRTIEPFISFEGAGTSCGTTWLTVDPPSLSGSSTGTAPAVRAVPLESSGSSKTIDHVTSPGGAKRNHQGDPRSRPDRSRSPATMLTALPAQGMAGATVCLSRAERKTETEGQWQSRVVGEVGSHLRDG